MVEEVRHQNQIVRPSILRFERIARQRGMTGNARVLARLMTTMIYQVQPADPLTYVGVTALVCAVAALSALLPARRATRVDPIIALRYE